MIEFEFQEFGISDDKRRKRIDSNRSTRRSTRNSTRATKLRTSTNFATISNRRNNFSSWRFDPRPSSRRTTNECKRSWKKCEMSSLNYRQVKRLITACRICWHLFLMSNKRLFVSKIQHRAVHFYPY